MAAANRPRPEGTGLDCGSAANTIEQRNSAMRSSSRATRVPPMDVSKTAARNSRLSSSMTFNTRNLRPSTNVSDMKSSDQR